MTAPRHKSLFANQAILLSKLLIALFMAISSFQHLSPPDISTADDQMQDAVRLMDQKQYEPSIPKIKNAIGIYAASGNDTAWIKACKKLDLCFYYLNKPDEGILFFENILKSGKPPANMRADLLLLLGDNYYLKSDYARAIETYEKGLPLAENDQATDLLLRYYANLGWLYWDAGNHAKALEFQKKSLELAVQQRDSTNIPTLLAYIGDTYRTMNDPQALDYFRRARALAPENAQTLIQFSKAYQQFNMPDSALAVLTTVLPLLKGDTEKADAYYQFARLYLDERDLPRAIANIDKALKYGLKGYGEKNSEYARMTTMAGKIYLAAGDADQALRWFDHTLSNQSTGKDLSPGSYWVLGSLEGKGRAFFQQYRESKQIAHLDNAFGVYDSGLQYAENMRLSHSHESSKLELYEYIQPIVEGGVRTALELAAVSGDNTFVEKAYLFAERAKAPVMAEALYDREIKHVAGIPDSVLAHEQAVQEALVQLELAVHDEPENDSLQQVLLDAQIGMERLKDEMKRRFPRYYEMKYAFSKQAGLPQIRQAMDDDARLVQYLMGDSALYVFTLTKADIKSYLIPVTDSLKAALEMFHRSVSDWDFVQYAPAQAEKDFLAAAPALYEALLARPLAGMKAGKLIIVPDGYLGLIPFEALLTTQYSGSWKDLDVPYLIRDYSISYAWSAAALHRPKTNDRKPPYNFVGIGTEYDAATFSDKAPVAMRDLGPLPNADDEVAAIGSLLHGKTWLNAEATKEHFLASAPECGILHIATHGVLDEQNPMMSCLVFNKSQQGASNQLFASELYNIQLQAQMTVLSACNTGQGRVHNGEGVMSLARAFAFAGCPTLVSSLWRVNDLSTSTVMKGFYKMLKSGKSVDASMREAKLEYLAGTSAEYAKPIYWAGFVVIGKSDALPEHLFNTGITWWWWIAAGALALGMLYFLFYKKRQRR